MKASNTAVELRGWGLMDVILGVGVFALAGAVNGQTDNRILNAGRGGDTTRDLLRRLDSAVVAQRPTLVPLMVGTNDALNHAKAVPLAEYRKNLSELVRRIRACGARVLLFTIPPCCEQYLLKRHPKSAYGPGGPSAAVDAVNRVVRELAGREKIPLVDVGLVFDRLGAVGTTAASLIRNPANSKAEDGVHPTPRGYAVIAAMAFQAIRDSGLPTNRIVCFGDSITFGANVKGQGTAMGETYPGQLAVLLHGPTNRRAPAAPPE